MMGLGVPELLVIGVLIFILFGGKKFASLGKDLGSGIRNLKEGLKEIGKDETKK